MGRAQEQAEHELRQTEPRAAILLRQEHHDQGVYIEDCRFIVFMPHERPSHLQFALTTGAGTGNKTWSHRYTEIRKMAAGK